MRPRAKRSLKGNQDSSSTEQFVDTFFETTRRQNRPRDALQLRVHTSGELATMDWGVNRERTRVYPMPLPFQTKSAKGSRQSSAFS